MSREEAIGAVMKQFRRRGGLGLLLCATLMIALATATCPSRAAGEETDSSDLRKELIQLKAQMKRDREESRRREEQERRRVEELEQRLQQVQTQTAQGLSKEAAKTDALQAKVTEESQAVAKVQAQPTEAAFNSYIDRFVGSHNFTLTGDFQVIYKWNDRDHKNTFAVDNFAPIFLYQVNDRLLFEGEIEFKLAAHEDETPEVEYMQADYLVNDYLTLVAGKFTLPFGDYFERLHQKWIMKFVDRPLLYRPPDQGGIMQDNGVGIQARGAVPLGYGDGTWAEYSVYAVNGPFYESSSPGAFFGDNQVDNNQGKGYGARIGFDLLPIQYEMGRLHLDASTFDGSWDTQVNGGPRPGDNLWFTSWGVGMDYQMLPFELRGEYLQSSRNMGPLPDDKREGWYIEGSYLLNQLPIEVLNRMEVAVRWSGVNQNVIQPDDSFTAFTRKPRKIDLGLDYWLAPSEVIKLQYEYVMQHNARNFNGLLTSFAYGF